MLGGLLLATGGLLFVAPSPAGAANTNVTIVTGGNYPISCDAASYAYSPIEVAVAPGDTVTFSNPATASNAHPCSPADHPTRCAPETNFGKTKGDCPFSNFGLETGASHTQPFPTEGTFQLQCLAHPYMLMTVVVGDGEPGGPPEPEPTATTPGPNPAETTAPPATATPTATASPEPTPTDSGRATEAPTGPSAEPSEDEPAPTEAATDPTALDDVDVGTTTTARGPLLILATALLGANVALFSVARGPFALPSFLR